ncbi:MAG TPA: hypothetical protein VFM88_10115 [Vicinamibacteria bacterium]|nr:hypothetical protein [Vicinamibacteria bacterium]
MRVGPPGSETATLLPALVDTGADCTLVPLTLARALELPVVDETMIEGIASEARPVAVCAARVEFAGGECLARVVAFGNEAVLGRDLLNRYVAHLDGPRLRLSFGPVGSSVRRRSTPR